MPVVIITSEQIYEAILYLNAASKQMLKDIRNNSGGHVVLLKEFQTSFERINSLVPNHQYVRDDDPSYFQLKEWGLIIPLYDKDKRRWHIELTHLGIAVSNELNRR